jgi:MerR family transcriptional regulator/heat shock protein HspR
MKQAVQQGAHRSDKVLQSRIEEMSQQLASVRTGPRRELALVPKSTAVVVWQPRTRPGRVRP